MKIAEFIESLKQAFDSMRTNKMRALLSSLGVVIGISFVILMGWVLSGLDNALEETINLLGTDMLYVDKWDWIGGRNWEKMRQRKNITIQQANEFADKIKTAEYVIPSARKWGTTLKYKDETLSGISVEGTFADLGLTPSGEVVEGRFFSETEEKTASKIAVIGYGVYKSFFDEKDAIGKVIKIGGHKYTIIGVIKKQATLLTDFVDQVVYIPFHSFTGQFGISNRSISVAVKAGNQNMLDEVRAETEGLMREIRNVPPGRENDFSINESKAFEDSIKTFRLAVWSIGIGMTVLSFIVGIIGIMNIMFVSVAERTKEIGIRKAIGAKKRSILMQFIVESSALCLIGAFCSFIGCSIIIYALATLLPTISPSLSFLSPFMPFELLLISSIVSIIVGVFAGIIPAIRASNLDPVDALRYE